MAILTVFKFRYAANMKNMALLRVFSLKRSFFMTKKLKKKKYEMKYVFIMVNSYVIDTRVINRSSFSLVA